MSTDDLPASLRRLWGLPGPTTKHGRPSSLDTETVVRTAIALADRDGVEAATLPKVAVELGVTAMSLYRHVGSKQELLDLMVDRASTPPIPETPVGDEAVAPWRPVLQTWAEDLWDLYCERPWIVQVPVHGPPAGPNQLAWLDQALTAFAATGIAWRERLGFCMVVNSHVRQSVLLTQDLAAGRHATEEQAAAEYRYGLVMSELTDSNTYPAVAAMFASTVFEQSDEPSMDTARRDFRDGLTVILDGIEARLHSGR